MKNFTKKFLGLALLSIFIVSISAFKSVGKEPLKENKGTEIKLLFPIDGDMLNETDGVISGGALNTKLKIEAPSGSNIMVNGVKAKYVDGIFTANVKLKNYENTIRITEANQGYNQSIKVFWLKNYVGKYRFSIDDNILFLKDINANKDKYKSIFDNPYLGFLKQVHDTYGTKFHLNLFYQVDGFNLSQMTDKFKDEFKANSGWLGFSFHALQEFPDKIYIKAGYDQVAKDCDLLKAQLKRFAGDAVEKETTLHWGEGTVEGCRALRDRGYTALAGYFNVDDNGAPVSYYLTPDQRRHLKSRFIWRDNKEGIIFARVALVVNTVKLEEVLPYLDNVKKTYNPHYIDLMIHEQYFYPDYAHYQPDFRQKVLTAVKWAVDNGYKPGFLKECVFK